MAKAREPAEESDPWSNWWSRPVVTSGLVLGAALVGFVGLMVLLVGLVLLVNGLVLFGVLCCVAAAVPVWLALRLMRRAR